MSLRHLNQKRYCSQALLSRVYPWWVTAQSLDLMLILRSGGKTLTVYSLLDGDCSIILKFGLCCMHAGLWWLYHYICPFGNPIMSAVCYSLIHFPCRSADRSMEESSHGCRLRVFLLVNPVAEHSSALFSIATTLRQLYYPLQCLKTIVA